MVSSSLGTIDSGNGLLPVQCQAIYRKTSNIRCTLVGNKIIDHSYVVGALPVGAAPTTSSFSIWYLASMDLGNNNCKTRWETFQF